MLRTLARFRRKQRSVLKQLRQRDKFCKTTLGPALAAISADLEASYAVADPKTKASLVRRLKEVDELLIRELEALDMLNPTDMAMDIGLHVSVLEVASVLDDKSNSNYTAFAQAQATSSHKDDDAETLFETAPSKHLPLPKRSASVASAAASDSHLSDAETLQDSSSALPE
ncbi:UNVERIFIED_CONTAM: hypothetical protein HDU68_004311, partial [Siphonaria sp. JEL0065]